MVTMELGQRLSDCARDWANASMTALQIPGGVHPATVLAGGGRMADTFPFRSFELTLPGLAPGDAVLSEHANQHSPMLIKTTANILTTLKVGLADWPPAVRSTPNTRAATVFLDTQRILEPALEPRRERCGLSLREAAQAAAVTTAKLINHFARHLDPDIAFGVAVQAIIEGCKTAPDPVQRKLS